MRVFGACVLVMESLTLGFAILLAIKDGLTVATIYGSIISLLLFLTAGLLKRPSGFYVGSVLQIFMIAFSFFVPSFFFMGVGFAGLWVAAIVIGRKGEAARAQLLAQAKAKDE